MSMAESPHLSEPAAFVVMGVSGSGKTVVGEAVAENLGLPFLEGDPLHPKANIDKMSRGTPLTDDDRFPWLDKIGAELAKALAAGGGVVVSCSALKKIYRERLRAATKGRLIFLFLKGSEQVLAPRMAARKGHFLPASLLTSQLATLEDPSGEQDVLVVDISGSSEEVIEDAIGKARAAIRMA
jgi:gluconokinase